MCGIAGIFDYGSAEPKVSPKILKNMTDVIVHRGPDSDGHYISPNGRCGLGFRRLAIIDLSSAGNQPMSTPDGRYTIVFNGEIYNHQSIRQELISLGYKYSSGTDTETILYGYAEWGEAIIERLLGMFAFAIWDNHNNTLFSARDRIGVKPYYFYQNGSIFAFGSEIKSILEHPSVHKEMNLNELPNYLNFGLSSRHESMFKNVQKLSSGHCLKVNSRGEIKIRRYWSPFNPDAIYTKDSTEEIQTEIMRLLRSAVDARMMSDVPFGVFLSGGIDSSVNVALMAELMNRPVDTFTVGFKQLEKYNELEYARRIAGIFKTNHREILIDHDDALPILESLAWHEDEPNADPVCIPLYFLSKLTRDSGTIVVQVGEGSDEQFAGYPWMIQHYRFSQSYWKAFNSMPGFLKKAAYSGVKPFFGMANQDLALDLVRRAAYDEEYYWSGVSIFAPTHQNKLFGKAYSHLSGNPAEYATSLHEEALSLSPKADYFQRMLFTEINQRLAEILLMRVDKIGMAHSIEARVPFLDHRLVEYTMSIPPNIKMPKDNQTKILLKKAVESILPKDIIYRKKQGFAAPVSEWINNQWNSYAKHEIYNSELVKSGILQKSYIERLFAEHEGGRNRSQMLFALLMLAVWHKRFF